MLKGKHFFSKGKPKKEKSSVVKAPALPLEVANEPVLEVLDHSEAPEHVLTEAETEQDSPCFDSVSKPFTENTSDLSGMAVDSQTSESEKSSGEIQDNPAPITSVTSDTVCHQERTESPNDIEDDGDLLDGLFSFGFMSEKKPDNGEDSDPLLLVNPKFSAVGVFDGMGGAGSAIHIVSDQEKTGAYLASRKTKTSLEALLESICECTTAEIDRLRLDEEFKSAIIESLSSLKKECPPKIKSGLKSAMIKEFPTTLAITTLRKRQNKYLLDSFWAGDSRTFFLSSKGLFQTSIDDLEKRLDPYENLYSDSPLSNQVCADRPFCINHITFTPATGRFAIISATDGCFGYYPTPMHFEDALLRNLNEANNIEEWKDALKNEFADIAADDTSFSCIIIGYESFDELKAEMENRFSFIHAYIEDYNDKASELTQLKQRVNEKEAAFKEYKQGQWDQYKVDYMSFLNTSE